MKICKFQLTQLVNFWWLNKRFEIQFLSILKITWYLNLIVKNINRYNMLKLKKKKKKWNYGWLKCRSRERCTHARAPRQIKEKKKKKKERERSTLLFSCLQSNIIIPVPSIYLYKPNEVRAKPFPSKTTTPVISLSLSPKSFLNVRIPFL